MSHIVIESVVGADGNLHLDVPIGIDNANQPVRVVIEAARTLMTREEWGAFVRSMAGSITDPTFERPPPLAFGNPARVTPLELLNEELGNG